jgi:hypothetical protein
MESILPDCKVPEVSEKAFYGIAGERNQTRAYGMDPLRYYTPEE